MNSELLRAELVQLVGIVRRISALIDPAVTPDKPPIAPKPTPDKPPISPKPGSGRGGRARAIEAIDPVTGEVAQRFASQHEATQSGFTQSCISACIRGRVKRHGGYQWRRAA